MINGPFVRSSINRQWIKANIIGATANAVAGLCTYILNALAGAGSESIGIGTTITIVLSVAMNALAVTLYGYLLGVVLRQKIPAFPMRNWIAMYALLGIGFGALTAYVSVRPEGAEPADPALIQVTGEIMLGALIAGSIIGALSGAVQALILSAAARGLGGWIEFSAIAGGPVFALVVATASVAVPGTFASELVSEAAMFVGTVLAAFIMLPAVWRLEPRASQ
jgi:hypothetical protein